MARRLNNKEIEKKRAREDREREVNEGQEIYFTDALAREDTIINVLGLLCGAVRELTRKDHEVAPENYFYYAAETEKRIAELSFQHMVDRLIQQEMQYRATDIVSMTRQFMETAGQPFGAGVSDEVDDLRNLRMELMKEEYSEYILGEHRNDPVEIADGLADIIVIAVGSLFSYFGEDKTRRLLAEVGASNLSKFEIGEDGEQVAIKREDGKVLKGKHYFSPDVAGILSGDFEGGE